MAGGKYLCAVCHKPFSSIGAKPVHINEKHPEAAHLYLQLDQERRTLLRVYDLSPPRQEPVETLPPHLPQAS
jgi:hypothetical protein